MPFTNWSEALQWARHQALVIGVDEVGRGCLAGPLVVAAVTKSKQISDIDVYFLAENGQSLTVFTSTLSPTEAAKSHLTKVSDKRQADHEHPSSVVAPPSFPASSGPVPMASATLRSTTSKTCSNPLDFQTLQSFCANWFKAYLADDTQGKLPNKRKSIGLDALDDSKKLSSKQRQKLTPLILKHFHISLVVIPPNLIDRVNILQATLLGMEQATQQMKEKLLSDLQKHYVTETLAFIDGPHVPKAIQTWSWPVIDGDALVPEISAASIVAKVFRDDWMQQLDAIYPGYAWASHKGYGTAIHLSALKSLGPTPMHRMSFAPVAEAARNRIEKQPL